jgi:hypothetical protein
MPCAYTLLYDLLFQICGLVLSGVTSVISVLHVDRAAVLQVTFFADAGMPSACMSSAHTL